MTLSTPLPSTDNSTVKLPVHEKLAYGAGDLIFATLSVFLMFYYTDIFGLSAAAVGTLLFVARAADASNRNIGG
ncbi:MAG: MFS transporter [Burkholderiaceae bacterium]|nr:MFS transporter [Burkholderiaceae bacterium]